MLFVDHFLFVLVSMKPEDCCIYLCKVKMTGAYETCFFSHFIPEKYYCSYIYIYHISYCLKCTYMM
jgi:hypothetical protein